MKLGGEDKKPGWSFGATRKGNKEGERSGQEGRKNKYTLRWEKKKAKPKSEKHRHGKQKAILENRSRKSF